MTGPVRPDKNLVAPLRVTLPEDHADALVAPLLAGQEAVDLAAVYEIAVKYPASSLIWAVLAELSQPDVTSGQAPAGSWITSYAYARTGYHRGLDSLRRAGWRGQGIIVADHQPNQGFLRALLALAEAAEHIGEQDEADRCIQFLYDSGTDPQTVRGFR